uniref:melanoma-associated antigen 10-like n=1 Tax=Jaculus jaculus TaxID=51337 RepID=UPI001E1B0471|nr:melanoma-associated antigen 10-like [Jaculus jaculus]
MSEPQKPRRSLAEENLESDNNIQNAPGGQKGKKEDGSSSTSTCSSSSHSLSFPSSSVCTMVSSVSVERIRATRPSNQSPPSGGFSSSFIDPMPCNQSVQGSPEQNEMQPIYSQALRAVAPCLCVQIDAKVNELVWFLLKKYRMRELTTTDEMLYRVIKHYQKYYLLIFYTACQYLLLIFGTEVKEVDPSIHSYCLVPALGLTYDGMLSDIQGIPKTGLLLSILSLIYKKNRRVSVEVMWNVLNSVGLFDNYRFIYAHAWKLITEDFVQEGYLIYSQVPHSDPAHYEFMWGPRAHAEIHPIIFMKFVIYVNLAKQKFCPCSTLNL